MNKKRILLIVLVGISNVFAYSSNFSLPPAPFEGFGVGIDKYYPYVVDIDDAKMATDSIYAIRFWRLSTITKLPYNSTIRNRIDFYLKNHKSEIGIILGLSDFYFPIIEQILEANNLPKELKYLTVKESSLDAASVSSSGTVGLWQFTLATGKRYGLEINDLVDERKDPIKSTYAACMYLKELYQFYNDWILVIAAYNCGSGSINKILRRAKNKMDYWTVLPHYVQDYVYSFITINYVMNYYRFHQIQLIKNDLPVTGTVAVNHRMHFDQIAEIMNIDKVLLRRLNPQYKKDIVPVNAKSRTINLPIDIINAFAKKKKLIANYYGDILYLDNKSIYKK